MLPRNLGRAGYLRGRVWLGLLLLLCLCVQPALAQNKRDQAGEPGARVTRIRNKRARLLRTRLGLEENRARKVEALFDAHASDKKKTRRAIRAARRKVHALLRDDSDDQAAYRAALDALLSANADLQRLQSEHLTQLRATLTPKEQARLLQMMQRARRHIRRASRRRR